MQAHGTFNTDEFKIRVYIITYHRTHLLKRAIESVIAQTHNNWIAEVLNDDPDDLTVGKLIAEIADNRIHLSVPALKRGGTGNFNYAFKKISEPFAAILEDDNWYEATYFETMLKELLKNPSVEMAVANERIWIEKKDGQWDDTGKNIWNENGQNSLYQYSLKEKCGSAKICNSSMFWRTEKAFDWLTPADLPIDVTEHFRERVLPHPILLVKTPLVNFAQTLTTNRSNIAIWGSYQVILIASVFSVLSKDKRNRLAADLWDQARMVQPQFKTTLLHTAIASREARLLLKKASFAELLRYGVTLLRRPFNCYKMIQSPRLKSEHYKFLIESHARQTNECQ